MQEQCKVAGLFGQKQHLGLLSDAVTWYGLTFVEVVILAYKTLVSGL